MKLKKILSLLLAMTMLFSCIGITAFAEDDGFMNLGDIQDLIDSGEENIVLENNVFDGVTDEAGLKEALQAGGSITLGGNIEITEMIEIPVGVEVELDLAGYAITSGFQTNNTSKHIYPFSNYGVFTITDSSTDKTGSISGRGIYNQDGAKITVNNAKIVSQDTNGGACIWGYGTDGEVYLDDATLIGYTGVVSSEGYVEINGGTYTCYSGIADDGTILSSPTYNIRAYNGLKITDGDFTSRHGVIYLGGGEAVIEDGTYTIEFKAATTSNVVFVYGDTDLTINGGEFISDDSADVADSGAAVLVDGDSVKLTINDGTYVGMNGMVSGNDNTVIKGGSFDTVFDYNHYDNIEEFVETGAVITVAGETIIKNEDGTMSVVVAKIGDTYYSTFDDALEAAKAMEGNVTVEIYDKVTLNQNLAGSFSSINFVGKAENAEIYMEIDGYIEASGKDVSFADLALSKSAGPFVNNAGFMNVAFGVYEAANVSYTDCTFVNGAYASKGTNTFTGCTFYRSHDKYGLWAYGSDAIVVDDCTFDDYRGIKMYDENKGANNTTVLTVKNTDFSAVTDKPAIVLTYAKSITLENNTYSSTGVFELDLDGAPNGTPVASDKPEEITCKNDDGACGVLVDGKIYTTVAQAAEVATAGSEVTLLHNSTETVELPEGVTLNTNGYTAEDVTVKVLAPTGVLGTMYVQAADTGSNNTDRNRVYGEITGMANINESLVVKLYSDETLLATTTLAKSEYLSHSTLGVNIVISGSTSSSWNTVWEDGMPRADLVPTSAVLYLDGTEMNAANVTLDTIDNLGSPTVWETLPGVNPAPVANAAAKIGDKEYSSVASALADAKSKGMKDVVITLVGETTPETQDSFDLIYGTAFDSVTFEQEDNSKPYYIKTVYTGDRTAENGKFIFDGVNLVITGQIWFECDVVLKNNATVTRTSDTKNFIYYGNVTIEPGSKFISQIDDVFAGSFVVDGGRNDGGYNETYDYKSIYVDVRAGQTMTFKNGAYVLFNSANEIGKFSVMGTVNVQDSKLEVFDTIAVSGAFNVDTESIVKAKKITGTGTIYIDASGFNGTDTTIIDADMLGFTGGIEPLNNDSVEVEIVNNKVILKNKVVLPTLSGSGTEEDPFLINNLDDLILFRDSVNAGETTYNAEGVYVALGDDIDMSGIDWSVNIGDDCNATFDGIFDGKNHTISNLSATETAQKGDGFICSGLFGAIYGSAQIKNLTIKNATINTGNYTGSNVGVVAGFTYDETATIENVKVIGDIKIDAPKATGVGTIVGYAYYGNPTIKDCVVDANEGSYIKAKSEAGGIIGYGGAADIVNCSVKNLAITADGLIGGIAGLLFEKGTVNGGAVNNVAFAVNNELWVNSAAIAVGTIASEAIPVSGVEYSDVTENGEATSVMVGSAYTEKPTAVVPAVQAKVGDKYYTTFEKAFAAAQAGDTVTLLTDIKLTGKLTIDKAITLDGNGHSIIADETAVWYTVSGKLNIKNYNTHLIGVNSDNITLQNIVLDNNNNAAGINLYCAQNVVFDNVSIINSTKGFAALTVNGSTLTVKNKFEALGNSVAIDISNGSGVTSALGVKVEEGTVFNLADKTVKFASVAVNDMSGAVTADGEPYFAAMDVAYYYTENQINSRTTAFSNGLTLLSDVELSNVLKVQGTLDLNGNTLTIAEDKVIEVSSNITVNTVGGTIKGKFNIATATASITAAEGLDVTTSLDGYKVVYADGKYSLEQVNYVAQIGDNKYTSLEAAINAAQANDTIVLLDSVNENVTIAKSITLDGADKNYTGTMTVSGNINVAVNNVNFVKGSISDPDNSHGYLTIDNCSFDGVDKSIGYAITIRGGDKLVIENCTAKNYSTGMLYIPSSVANISVKDVKVSDVAAAFNISYSGNGTFENVNLTNVTYGLHVQNHGARTFTLKGWNADCDYPLYIQEKGTKNVTFEFVGENALSKLTKNTYAKLVLGEADAVLTAPEGYNVTTDLEGYIVKYAGGVYKVVEAVAQIGDTYYETFEAAIADAKDNDTITLIWEEGDAPIAMNGAVYGKSVTITGDATVDWSKNFLFVGRGGEGNGTVIFDKANLKSASNSSSYGIHVSGREKDTTDKYDGTVIIKDSTIELDYLINKSTMTLDNSKLTVKNGFSVGGRPASETESGEDAIATITLNNNSKVIVNKHNGMGLGYEALGVMNIESGSTFEYTQDFLITAKGTMNVNGGKVIGNNVTLTNKGTINVSGTSDIAANVTGDGWVYMNGVTMSDDTKLIGAKVRFASGTNNIDGSVIDDGFFQVGIGAYNGVDANVDTTVGVTVNVKNNATIGSNGDTYAGWVGTGFYDTDAEKADVMTDAKYVLNIDNSIAKFGYLHISNDGELNVNGNAAEKVWYNNSDYSFYAGDFIINGTATFDETDVLALYTKVSCDNGTDKPGTLNIVNGTEYEAERHNGAISGTNFELRKTGVVDVDEASELHIGECTSIATDAVMNIGGKATALGTITNNGTINLTTVNATLTTPEISAVKTTVDGYEVAYADGKYSLKEVEEVELFEFYGASPILGNSLAIEYYVATSNFFGEGYYAEVEHETATGVEKTIIHMEDWSVHSSKKYYLIRYDNITAKQITENMFITIYDSNGKQVSVKREDGIRAYAERMLADGDLSDVLKTTLVDMLNYGAAAQLQFNYRTDMLANAMLTEEQQSYASAMPTLVDERVYDSTKSAGSSLVLKDNILLDFYFAGVAEDMRIEVSYTKHNEATPRTYTYNYEDLGVNGKYRVLTIDTLVVADAKQLVTVNVYNNDGSIYTTYVDSMNSYLARQLKKGEEPSGIYGATAKFTSSSYDYLH